MCAEITAFASEERLGVDFSDIWAHSGLARRASSPCAYTATSADEHKHAQILRAHNAPVKTLPTSTIL